MTQAVVSRRRNLRRRVRIGCLGIVGLLVLCIALGAVIPSPEEPVAQGNATPTQAGIAAEVNAEVTPTVAAESGASPTIAPSPIAATETAPAPTAEPTAAPTRTPKPKPTKAPTAAPEPATFESGGLGLSREDWEQLHGAPTRDTDGLVAYEDDVYLVIYQDDKVWNLTAYPESGEAVPLAEARALGKGLIPQDAKKVKTYKPDADRVVDVHRSKSLRSRFGTMTWLGDQPGTFILLYKLDAAGDVHTIMAAPGNNP